MKRCVLFERRLTPIGWRAQMRISPLLRRQPKTSSFMLETISRTVARSDTMLGKEYNVRTALCHNSRVRACVCVCGGSWLICYFRLFFFTTPAFAQQIFFDDVQATDEQGHPAIADRRGRGSYVTTQLCSCPAAPHVQSGGLVIASLSLSLCVCGSCVRVLRATVRG